MLAGETVPAAAFALDNLLKVFHPFDTHHLLCFWFLKALDRTDQSALAPGQD